MKKRYRIPPSLVEKYKEDICFMVETDFTCMEVVIPRMKFIEPVRYEISAELIEGYTQIILQLEIHVLNGAHMKRRLEKFSPSKQHKNLRRR